MNLSIKCLNNTINILSNILLSPKAYFPLPSYYI